jgi:hypothetical protein
MPLIQGHFMVNDYERLMSELTTLGFINGYIHPLADCHPHRRTDDPSFLIKGGWLDWYKDQFIGPPKEPFAQFLWI